MATIQISPAAVNIDMNVTNPTLKRETQRNPQATEAELRKTNETPKTDFVTISAFAVQKSASVDMKPEPVIEPKAALQSKSSTSIDIFA